MMGLSFGRWQYDVSSSKQQDPENMTHCVQSFKIIQGYHNWYDQQPVCDFLLRPHSIILASCKPGCKPCFFYQVCSQVFDKFVRVCDMLSTCFRHAFDTLSTFFVENLVANLLHQSRHVEIDAAGSLVCARARQMECRKNPFRASQRTCWSWIFVTYFIKRAYHDVTKWKNSMKKLDFTPKTL